MKRNEDVWSFFDLPSPAEYWHRYCPSKYVHPRLWTCVCVCVFFFPDAAQQQRYCRRCKNGQEPMMEICQVLLVARWENSWCDCITLRKSTSADLNLVMKRGGNSFLYTHSCLCILLVSVYIFICFSYQHLNHLLHYVLCHQEIKWRYWVVLWSHKSCELSNNSNTNNNWFFVNMQLHQGFSQLKENTNNPNYSSPRTTNTVKSSTTCQERFSVCRSG